MVFFCGSIYFGKQVQKTMFIFFPITISRGTPVEKPCHSRWNEPLKHEQGVVAGMDCSVCTCYSVIPFQSTRVHFSIINRWSLKFRSFTALNHRTVIHDELGICRNINIAYFKYCHRVCVDGLRKTR
jgi:hypothetical protein